MQRENCARDFMAISPTTDKSTALEGKTMNKWAVINSWTGKVVAEVTHYQLAASVENDLSSRWVSDFVGPLQRCYPLPFTVSRI